MTKKEFREVVFNPSRFFRAPEAVVETRDYTKDQKIEILKSWAYDAREMEVAEEEGMGARGPQSILPRVLACLRELGANLEPKHPAPSKHQPLG